MNLDGWPITPGKTPSIVQQGVIDGGKAFRAFGPGGAAALSLGSIDRPVHLLFPYVMPTAAGGMALFYTRHTRHGYPELVWTGRRAGDPLNKMYAARTVMQSGTAGIQDSIYWGEYEGIALDPTDENRVWATGQLGRCCPQAPCNDVPPCIDCAGGGVWQTDWHTSIGSYTIPAGPVRTVNIVRQTDLEPPPFTVKTMPTDVDSKGYAVLSNVATTFVRLYGDGQQMFLEAPASLSTQFVFDHWERDGVSIGTDTQIEVTADADMTLSPVYVTP